MEMSMWILFCFFASVGFVQCAFWLIASIKKREKQPRGYHLIPMYDDAERLESQIRHAFSLLRNDGEHVLLVDMGLSEELQQMCNNLTLGCGGIYICAKDDIGSAIQSLDDLQLAANVVE